MPVGEGYRPFQVNLSPDGVGRGSGKGGLRLLPGNTPLGEPIQRRPTEQAKPTLGQEINAYLNERARLRAEGLLPTPEGKPPIVTQADAISVDLHALLFSLGTPENDEQWTKYNSIDRISWGVDALVFGLLSQPMQDDVTIRYEFTRGFNRNHPQILEDRGKLSSQESAILAEQLHKLGLPFKLKPEGITIPFALTVQKMREIVGGEPLWEIPAPGEVPDDISRYRDRRR